MADPSNASKTAAVVLAYHPPPSTRGNIDALLKQVDRVFLVNNSPDEASLAFVAEMAADPRITVLNQKDNVGVAAGFNAGMRVALDEDYGFVWIFDQDSTVSDGMLDMLLDAYRAATVKVGLLGPALRADETKRIYDKERGTGVERRDVLISSGALFPAEVLRAIGLHDETLFIDYVDHDISLRSVQYGFTNLKVFGAVLDHRFGDSEPARFLGRRVYLSNYSPMRQYYMSRNRVILFKRYGAGPWFWEDLSYFFKAWTKVLFCETDRRPKIAAFWRGLRDGLRAR